MAESDRIGSAESPVDQMMDQRLAMLRMQAADRFDPVRFRFLEALATRVRGHQGAARRILDGRLSEALAAYRERLEQGKNVAQDTLARMALRYPDAGDDLQRLFVAGDFSAMNRLVAGLERNVRRASVADLTRHLAQHSPADADAAEGAGSHAELRTLRHFRNAWSKLSVAKQLTQAIEQAPENAGPLNSHMLVLRSLALMRDISPDYLNRFMSYADTLLALDLADKKNRPTAKKPLAAKSTRR